MTKKTKKGFAPRRENPRAQRTFLILIGLSIWASAISIVGVVYWLIKGADFSYFVATLILISLIGNVIGLWGIIKMHPPLHYLIYIAAIANLLVSLGSGILGLFFGVISILIIYFGIRFPIKIETGEKITMKRR